MIQHNDGSRELYFFRHADDDEPQAVIRLDDDEARQLGAVLGGAYERPKIVEDLEMALGELRSSGSRVPDDEPLDRQDARRVRLPREDRDHGDRDPARAGAVTGAQPDDVIQRGDTLVTVGKAGQYGAFRKLLAGS